MDEFENQALPREPEDMEEVTAVEIPAVMAEESAAAEETVAEEIPTVEETAAEEDGVFGPVKEARVCAAAKAACSFFSR